MPARGTTALYRPVPSGFDELFIRVGWSEIEAETQAHAKTIRKWIDKRNFERRADGLQSLQDARSAWVSRHGAAVSPKRIAEAAPRGSAARYVLGRRSARDAWPVSAPRFWDVMRLPGVSIQSAPEKPKRVLMSPLRCAVLIEQEAAKVPVEVRAGMLKAAELLRAQVPEINGIHNG